MLPQREKVRLGSDLERWVRTGAPILPRWGGGFGMGVVGAGRTLDGGLTGGTACEILFGLIIASVSFVRHRLTIERANLHCAGL